MMSQTDLIGRGAGRAFHRLLCTLILGSIAGVSAWADSSSSLNENLEQRRARLTQEMQQRQESRQVEWRQSNFAAFRDANGTPVLTNTPERYRNRQGYEEVKLDLQPVSTPSWYTRQAAATSAAAPALSSDLRQLVGHYSRLYQVEEALVYAVIRAESNFNPRAVSPKGAQGYMQLMPGTARDMGVSDSFDPAQNIGGGTQYLARMLSLFSNNVQLALAGYNAGPGAVQRHGGVPPYEETRTYIERVLRFRTQYQNDGFTPPRSAYHHATPAQSQQLTFAMVPSLPRNQQYYTVQFKSGLSQPSEKVDEKGDYYILYLRGRTWQVRKDLVQEIVNPMDG